MTLALLLSLACAVQAEQAPPPTPQELLDQAHQGNRELTSNCPYNGATLQLMGTLIDQVPQDSATREGVDAMARMLGHPEVDPGHASVADTRARLEGIRMQVSGLSEVELAELLDLQISQRC